MSDVKQKQAGVANPEAMLRINFSKGAKHNVAGSNLKITKRIKGDAEQKGASNANNNDSKKA